MRKFKQTLLVLIVLIFILLFIYSGFIKLFTFPEFISEARQSPLLKPIPTWLLFLAPGSELLVAALLVTRHPRLLGLYASCLLMAAFTIYLIAIDQYSYFIPCSCGGIIDTLPFNTHLTLNFTLLLLAIVGIYLERDRKHIIVRI
jgi:uncharacterized membrane protein YphA (DoxX/SURF4 family)